MQQKSIKQLTASGIPSYKLVVGKSLINTGLSNTGYVSPTVLN